MEPLIISKITKNNEQLIKSFPSTSEVVESEESSYILLDMMRDVVDEYKFKYDDQNRDGKYNKNEHVYSRGTGSKLRTKYNFGFIFSNYRSCPCYSSKEKKIVVFIKNLFKFSR